MDERMNKLLDLENQILINRQELQRLMQESGTSDKNFMNDKLNQLKQEIDFMSRQVQFLQYDLNRQFNEAERLNQVREKNNIKESQQFNKEKNDMFEGKNTVVNNMVRPNNINRQHINEPKEKRDFEKTIGKSFMGIMASVLIFISLILFATVIVPFFGEVVKMVTTYVISFAFVIVGLIKLRKDNTNKFYISILACGVGAVYISLLLSNIYFKKIEEIPLYILICLWGIGVCFLGKLQNKIFLVIGEIGITISVIFGCGLCIDEDDVARFIALIMFYIVSSTVFYMVHFKKEFIENIVHHVFNVFNCWVILVTYKDIFEDDVHIAGYFILILLVFNLGSIIYNKIEKGSIIYGIIGAMYLFRICGILELICVNYTIFGIIVYIMSMSLIVVFEYKTLTNKSGINILHAVLVILSTIGIANCEDMFEYTIVLLMILPLMILGFYRKNGVLKYSPMVVFVPFVIAYPDMNIILKFVLVALVIGSAFFCISKCIEQYSVVFKYFMYVVSVLAVFLYADRILVEYVDSYDVRNVITYMSVALFNIVMLKSRFSTDFITGERDKPVVFNLINLLVMISGLALVEDGIDGFWNVLLIATIVGTYFINSKNILENTSNVFGGIYVGFKFTFLMIVLMESFDSINYAISIACFVFAIVCIVIGFIAKYKSLRIYGLVLSLISTFKLVMFDISYDNTLGHAVSFFVSGILCFVICLMYNVIDNKINKE